MRTDKPSLGFLSPGAVDGSSAAAAPQIGVFRKEGEYWTISIGANAVRLKDSKGLAYLACLLRHPGVEFHALYLVGGIASGGDEQKWDRLALSREQLEKGGIHIGNLGDAGELLDDRAKSAYRQRLAELREELEEAKALGKEQRADGLEEEIDALTRELSRAVGLAGRNRRAASASERARQTINKTIRAAMERIARSDALLADIFSRSIRTGTFCSYRPDPNLPIRWEFAATDIEPRPRSNLKATPASFDYMQSPSAMLGVLPFSATQQTPFVDREDECGVIRAAVERARNGSGSLVMLAGGPGVGKTRLTTEMGEYATRNGFAYFSGHCYEREEPFPYLPFVQIIETMLARAPSPDEFRCQIGDNAPELAQLVPSLRRVFPDISQPMELPDAQKQRILRQSVTEALGRAARRRPYLLTLDDLHWADEATLALLTHLANRIAQLPLLIIAIYRDEYSDDNPVLARTLEELIRQGIRPLKLTGLSKDSVAQMLNELSRREIPESLVKIIFEESNGNPFFVQEVYRHLVEEERLFDSTGQFRTDLSIDEVDVPDNVRLIITRRLKHFSGSEMRALSVAAVIGRSFSFQLLAAVSHMDVDELFAIVDRAQRMRIIVPSSERPEKPFTFAHELVRQTLLADISVARRQQLHAKVAAEMERLYPATVNEYAREIADHLLKAGCFADREAVVPLAIHV
jgi:AAA ATPase domain